MAGHTVSLYLKEKCDDVTGFARKQSQFVNTIIGDAFDTEHLKSIIDNDEYDYVINCIGLLNNDAEEYKSHAVYLNSFIPHMISDFTKESDTRLIQISTDCVFSGKRGQYTEYDVKDGENFYDRSKALGEVENNKDITIRTSIIGPDINPKGCGLLNWFLQQEKKVYGYNKAMWTGITTLELAKYIKMITKKKLYGLYNVVPDQSISKNDLLVLFDKFLKEEKVEIVSIDKPVLDKSLVSTKAACGYKIPGYEKMIMELKEWMESHKSLYRHYYNNV